LEFDIVLGAAEDAAPFFCAIFSWHFARILVYRSASDGYLSDYEKDGKAEKWLIRRHSGLLLFLW